jgi:hypothetical protein
MGEKKAVLNVTVDESVAESVRKEAVLRGSTISSVVEAALRDLLDWERTRREGLAAIDEYYREHGYPAPEVQAEAEAFVAEARRQLAEARRAMAEGSGVDSVHDSGTAA